MLSSHKISKILTKAGIRPSFQRIKIYEFLTKNNIHPTIDIVYRKLVKLIPTLSKTTVYNTVKLFEEKNLIRNVNIDENEIRYDAVQKIHGHFKCESCGKIFDFDYNYDELKVLGLMKFEIKKTDLNLKGKCPECINK